MRLRAVALALLVVIGAGAAATIWYCFTWTQVLASTDEVAARKIDALVEATGRFDAALRTLLGRRDADGAWFTDTSQIVTDLQARASELDTALPGVAMAPRARFAEVLQRARETVDGARANFDAGSTLMALDAAESNGRPAAEALWSELKAVRAAVATERAGAERRWWQRAGGAAAAWAVSWAIGLAWLARRREAPAPIAAAPEAVPIARPTEAAPEAIVSTPLPPPPVAPSIAEVADVCERIGQVRDAADVPGLLAGSAAALQATGLVLWVRDGDALVVGAAHGYPEGLAQRLGRVALADENLITRAWHGGRCQTSAASGGRRAAFAAPLVGGMGSVGVLAAEVRSEADVEAVAATARLVAGQFAAVLGETVAGTQGSAGDPPVATPNALAG